jgi:hypothetical protein
MKTLSVSITFSLIEKREKIAELHKCEFLYKFLHINAELTKEQFP